MAEPLRELFIASEPYPHLRAKNGSDGTCVLARDYQHESAQEYVRRANRYAELIDMLKRARAHLSDEYGLARDLGEEIDVMMRDLGETS